MPKAKPAPNLPDIRDLAEQVRFTPDTGRIWVRDQRGVLLTASVYGALRRELIDRLGPAYRAYSKRTPRFFPSVGQRRR